jgi:hypothetical protein
MKFQIKLSLIAGLILILALFHMPYGYYSFMRIAISLICVYNIYNCIELNQKDWKFFFYISCLILHNPIFKVHFKREEWFPIDIVCICIFAFIAYTEHKKSLDS